MQEFHDPVSHQKLQIVLPRTDNIVFHKMPVVSLYQVGAMCYTWII